MVGMDVKECPNSKDDIRECPNQDWPDIHGYGCGLASGEQYDITDIGWGGPVDYPYYEKVVGYGLQCLINDEEP